MENNNAPDPTPNTVPDYLPFDMPRFRIGQIVRHRRYGYYGLVVDFDLNCQADEQWYRANRSHPNQAQPWYHVLVNGSDMTTYAAEENLAPDEEHHTVTHPLVGYFFEAATSGRYIRNDEVWPGWEG